MSSAASAPAGVPVPSWWGVALSLVLVGIAGWVVLRARLGLTRELAVAAVRAAVQLTVVG
ncbi:MAG: UDP-glucose/iron transport system permease protein [Frankiales bacterium]|nr:UDP-glucose/iron transport system permease protein [Frankiales bacterium]